MQGEKLVGFAHLRANGTPYRSEHITVAELSSIWTTGSSVLTAGSSCSKERLRVDQLRPRARTTSAARALRAIPEFPVGERVLRGQKSPRASLRAYT